ncbi:MAG: translation initiation factor IF-1 [Candidatus Komeilibacteria bacterium]|nr:translation initiation factor IF-1 [Candidatus Komeilibacteria bacterium]
MAIEPIKPDNRKKAIDSAEGFIVNRKGFIEIDGEIMELLPAATFRVKLTNDHEILAHLSGRMRMNKIRLLPYDKIKIEMSPYDLTKGRITYRY